MYQKPLTLEEIEKAYPDIAKRLIKDPIHKWRAETGIELIHKEPTKDELVRIWNNWQQMNKTQKKLSDEKSKDIFGINNKDHYKELIKEY